MNNPPMKPEEILHCLALQQTPGVGLVSARVLYDVFGNATDVFTRRAELVHYTQPAQRRLLNHLDNPEALRRAERELEFAQKNGIDAICIGDRRYPSRLRECPDAPLVLFFKGDTNLNALRVVSMVGTRKATDYGRQLCNDFVRDLKALCPEVLIVSGLAYGIDIAAHRAALDNGLPTVGVLAHGLDRIYPPVHRNTAIEMLKMGGLLTEYMSETNPDRQNFVQRNRIVAGMADATIVVESAAKGGALITAGLATDYFRDCFAFPGRVGDPYSQGCNALVRDNKASLILSAEDFVKAMSWDIAPTNHQAPQAIQRQLFLDLSPDEEALIAALRPHRDGLQINTLVVEADIPINRASALLFELEMKGVVKALAGGVYKVV
ncbi:MAG: DNA-processing protein DprA [Bacteroidaceae bacterium]|nr:DNA-processing protein DprA [Bacteroidaceae bacterium]